MNEIKPGKYRHFKGNLYEVLYTAKHSESLEEMVVYRALYGEHGVWVRPASMWNEQVTANGITQPRFTYIEKSDLNIKIIEPSLCVCQVSNFEGVDLTKPFTFTATTAEESSLVCTSENIPKNAIKVESNWRGFYIDGTLDFSLVGILAKISHILASENIGIFAISTYNTDYILVKEHDLSHAVSALKNAGYNII